MTETSPSLPKVLITGGTGFAGSHLVEHLLDLESSEVHITTTGTKPKSTPPSLLPATQIHTLDLLDRAAVEELLKTLQPDHIYHLVAMAEVGSSFATAEKIIVSNTVTQLNLLEAIRQHSPQSRVLVVGSAQEYDVFSPEFKANPQPLAETAPLGPSNPYAVSKVTQDLLALSYYYSYHLDIVRVRPFNHIGERQSPQFAVAHFAQQIAQAELGILDTIKVGNLSAVRDFTDVKDVVKAYRLLMERGQAGEVYNLGSGQGYTMEEMLDSLLALAKVPIRVVTDPAAVRPVDMPYIIADTTKLNNLGWTPGIPMAETIARVLEYWRHHP